MKAALLHLVCLMQAQAQRVATLNERGSFVRLADKLHRYLHFPS